MKRKGAVDVRDYISVGGEQCHCLNGKKCWRKTRAAGYYGVLGHSCTARCGNIMQCTYGSLVVAGTRRLLSYRYIIAVYSENYKTPLTL